MNASVVSAAQQTTSESVRVVWFGVLIAIKVSMLSLISACIDCSSEARLSCGAADVVLALGHCAHNCRRICRQQRLGFCIVFAWLAYLARVILQQFSFPVGQTKKSPENWLSKSTALFRF
jgi:hypothetical protein